MCAPLGQAELVDRASFPPYFPSLETSEAMSVIFQQLTKRSVIEVSGGVFQPAGRTNYIKDANVGTNGASPATHKDAGSLLGQKELATLDKKLSNMQEDMQQAIQENAAKENEKFDLIFSILIELQRRQGQMEETVKSLKAKLESQGAVAGNLAGADQRAGCQQGQPTQAIQQVQMDQQMIQPMGFMGGQVPMGQQFATMDGGYFTPVVVAVPNGGNFGMPVMQAPMQPMVQFMPAPQQGQWPINGAATSPNNAGNGIPNHGQRSECDGQQAQEVQMSPHDGVVDAQTVEDEE